MNSPDDQLLNVLREIRDELRADREQRAEFHRESFEEWRAERDKSDKRQQQRDRLSTVVVLVAIAILVIGGLAILAWKSL